MESAENGFNKHHLTPFSKKNPRAVAASLTSREENLSSTILSFTEKKSVSSSISCTFHTSAFMANNEILQKKKMNTQSLKCLRMHHLHPFFRKFSRGGPRTPPPLLQRDIP